MGIDSATFEVGLGTDYEKSAVLGNGVQPRKVQIPPIHDIKCSSLQGQDIEGVNLVELAVGDVDERWNIAPKIQLGMQLDRPLGRAEVDPRKH